MNQTLQIWNNTSSTIKVNISSLQTAYRSDFYYIWITIFCVLFSSGAILNSMVVFVMLRSGKMRQNISSFLIFHMSVAHLLFHAGIPLFGIIYRSKGNSASCKILVLIDLTCAAAIFNSLIAVAWDRHRNILRPFKSLAPRNFKVYLMLVAAIWTYAFVTSAPFIFSVRTDSQVVCYNTNNGTKRCEKISFCHLPTDWKTKLSKTVYFLLAFVFPLFYMFFAYTKIAVSLWKRSKNGTIHSAVAKCKVKSIRLMISAVFGFVFCWGPKFFVDLLTAYGVYEYDVILYIWCYLAQMSSSSVNPVIYAFFSPEFRKILLKYCCCCCSRRVFSGQRRQCAANRPQGKRKRVVETYSD